MDQNLINAFDPASAHVWISDNSFKLAWEVAKANLNREEIHSGEHVVVSMGGAVPPVVR